MSRIACGLRGTGSAVPEKVLSNADLSELVDTSDEWITQRTGIKERRMVAEGESTSDLCIRAARQALEDADLAPEEVDLIVLGTVTPDQHVPATACLVQAGIGAVNAAAFGWLVVALGSEMARLSEKAPPCQPAGDPEVGVPHQLASH